MAMLNSVVVSVPLVDRFYGNAPEQVGTMPLRFVMPSRVFSRRRSGIGGQNN
jgi:hypothetical protein